MKSLFLPHIVPKEVQPIAEFFLSAANIPGLRTVFWKQRASIGRYGYIKKGRIRAVLKRKDF